MTQPRDRTSKLTIVIITVAVMAATALAIEGTYFLLKTYVLDNPDPLAKAGGLSSEQKRMLRTK